MITNNLEAILIFLICAKALVQSGSAARALMHSRSVCNVENKVPQSTAKIEKDVEYQSKRVN